MFHVCGRTRNNQLKDIREASKVLEIITRNSVLFNSQEVLKNICQEWFS